MANIPVNDRIFVGKKVASIDPKYGPWESIDEAYDALGPENMDVLALGLTVGIIEDGKIVEYWFQGGTEKENLIKKNNLITVEIKNLNTWDSIPENCSSCSFIYNGVAVYSVPCIYDNANCILVYVHTLDGTEEVTKAYIIAGRTIIATYEENDIPTWIKNYSTEYLASRIDELEIITTWK